MLDVLEKLLHDLDAARPVACCRLVETRGSTPQKAGAMMLVYPDGSQAGTLGGGCVEAEVKRRALGVLSDGAARVLKFQLDDDYGWDDGLICGGRMQVLVDPLCDEESIAYFRRLHEQAAGGGATEAIIFDAEKSPHTAGASFLFDTDDRLIAHARATLSDADAPVLVRENLKPLSIRPRSYAVGGVAYLPSLPRCRLLIVGGGHIGQWVARLAGELDFDVWVLDDRAEYVTEERFPSAQRRITGTIGEVLPGLEITSDTYCLIVTRGHNHDEEALLHLAERGARYVGMIGSRRKIRLIYDDLLAEGVSAEALAKVHAPLGIDIGSQTVAEIAVSIAAELVAHRNRDGRVPGRPEGVAVEEMI